MKPIERIQQNLLAVAERRVLNWLCARLPEWVKPDHLTSLGLVGALMVLTGYAASALHLGWLWLAIAGYCVHWFGDSLDGSLARFRDIERPRFGYFIDHSCDGLANFMIMAGLGLSPFVRFDVALFALTGYLLMSIHAFLSARVLGELKLSYIAAGPTELRVLLVAVTLSMFAIEPEPGWSPFDWLVGAAGAILLAIFVVQTIVTARRIATQGE
ncbi:MAG: CDP-alcohol phosphatidyltransferase family protein [Sphingomonas sp.]|uniref:CDP-alcohol phosphatidyltransferase family protein n=1 Tax=Sphingomonas sp. TaxID=28214 RepID=UPI0018426A2A|nr:CDP-alcohol phosphatidyltransferase family protein [Sphingomonas sp.]MBA3666578.1 CDP-alcohol phosphatidyltransferase family protein [Sphingomonas sp.]